jgi:hypothetical protein
MFPAPFYEQRTCETCGKRYSFEDHGEHGGVVEVAMALAAGNALTREQFYAQMKEGNLVGDWFVVWECPACAQKTKTTVIGTVLLPQMILKQMNKDEPGRWELLGIKMEPKKKRWWELWK